MRSLARCAGWWIGLWAVVVLAGAAQAEVPRTMAFQGRMADAQGRPLEGNLQVTFRIFGAAAGGTALWEETQTVSVSGGLFSAGLGAWAPLSVAFDVPYGGEIQAGGEVLSPRQPLSSAPYSQRAVRLDGINVVNGKVGIGTTAPARTLHVYGSNAAVAIQDSNPGGKSYVLTNAAAGDGGLGLYDGSVFRWYVTGAGNVGIGTASPAGRLDVAGTVIADYLQVDPQNASTEGGEILLKGAGSNPGWAIDVSGSRYRLHSGGAEKFTVTQTGNVGIGTTNPGGYRLYVKGAAYATGGWKQASSAALKAGIRRLGDAQEAALLSKLARTPVYRYRLRGPDPQKAVHLGILAEEAPAELVDDDRQAISYGDYLATLLAAVKAQQRRIGALESEVERLRKRGGRR